MDNDEDVRLQLHSSNTNSRTNCHPICTLYNAIVIILVLVVLVCGIAFAFIILERGKNIERRVILLDFQLKRVKRLLAEQKVLIKNSSTSETEIGKIGARQYGGSYISRKVQRPSLFRICYVWLDRHEFTAYFNGRYFLLTTTVDQAKNDNCILPTKIYVFKATHEAMLHIDDL